MLKWLGRILKIVGYAVVALVLVVVAYVFWLSGSSHEPTNVRPATAYTSPGTGPILVFGGNRATGLEIVRRLRERGESVTVAVRASSDTRELQALGVSTVVADALDAEQVRAAVSSAPYSAIISTLGTTRGDQARRPDYVGNRNVIDAAVAVGPKRFILITVIGAGESSGTEPFPASRFLAEVIALKTRAEEHLRASGLDYTIIRPGGLGDVAATGTAVLAADPQAFSYISRKDLADLAVQALGDPSTADQAYNAYDPSRKVLWNMYND